jgi:radical SAM-linked protein
LRYRLAIRFAVQDDLRFISHHDTLRMFERALARTGLPVRFSEGFNPRPKLSLPLPRPVGIASVADVLVVELTQAVPGEDALQQLSAQMPRGIVLQETWVHESSRPMQAESASYVLELPADRIAQVREQLSLVWAAETWPIQRGDHAEGPGKSLDLRQHLVEARIDSASLHWTVRVVPAGSVRPSEVLAAFGLDPAEWQHRVRRIAIQWAAPAIRPTVQG